MMFSLFGELSIVARLGIIGTIVLTIFGSGFYWGNRDGPNAWAYAQVVDQLRTKNAELTKLEAEDAVLLAQEMRDDDSREADFQSKAAGLNKCTIDGKQAEALNKLIGG